MRIVVMYDGFRNCKYLKSNFLFFLFFEVKHHIGWTTGLSVCLNGGRPVLKLCLVLLVVQKWHTLPCNINFFIANALLNAQSFWEKKLLKSIIENTSWPKGQTTPVWLIIRPYSTEWEAVTTWPQGLQQATMVRSTLFCSLQGWKKNVCLHEARFGEQVHFLTALLWLEEIDTRKWKDRGGG